MISPEIKGKGGGAASSTMRLLIAAPPHTAEVDFNVKRFSLSGKVSAYLISPSFIPVRAINPSGVGVTSGFLSMAPEDIAMPVVKPSAIAAVVAGIRGSGIVASGLLLRSARACIGLACSSTDVGAVRAGWAAMVPEETARVAEETDEASISSAPQITEWDRRMIVIIR